jgi:hypothetical protein
VRLWSLHPRYLDAAGLTAAWREALLAQKVLAGATRGYRRHPQLERFRPGSALAAGGSAAAVGVPPRGSARRPGDRAAAGWAGDRAGGTAAWPGDLIVAYLHFLADEADARGYRFDRNLVAGVRPPTSPVVVTDGQLEYEWRLLRGKLAARSPDVLARWGDVVVHPHPCFVVVSGPVASWEVVR